MMSDEHTLQLAIKYSSRMRFMQLAQRISEMAVRKAEEKEARNTERLEYCKILIYLLAKEWECLQRETISKESKYLQKQAITE